MKKADGNMYFRRLFAYILIPFFAGPFSGGLPTPAIMTEETVEIEIDGEAQKLDVYTLDGTDMKVVYVREPGQDLSLIHIFRNFKFGQSTKKIIS